MLWLESWVMWSVMKRQTYPTCLLCIRALSITQIIWLWTENCWTWSSKTLQLFLVCNRLLKKVLDFRSMKSSMNKSNRALRPEHNDLHFQATLLNGFWWHRIFWWLSARLQHLQCVSNGDTAVLHWAMDLYYAELSTYHYLNGWWSYYVMPYGITRSQWGEQSVLWNVFYWCITWNGTILAMTEDIMLDRLMVSWLLDIRHY